MATRRSLSPRIYILRIELDDIAPPIWRRLQVPTDITLPRLHDTLQVAMGWTDSHLHSFQIGDKEYSNSDELDDLNVLAEKGRKLDSLLGHALRDFGYLYDFGDSWQHRIVVESMAAAQPHWLYTLCVGGARACPPDDVGGTPGYQNFLDAIRNPRHDEHKDYVVWIGGAFDPEGFDINSVNRELRRRRL